MAEHDPYRDDLGNQIENLRRENEDLNLDIADLVGKLRELRGPSRREKICGWWNNLSDITAGTVISSGILLLAIIGGCLISYGLDFKTSRHPSYQSTLLKEAVSFSCKEACVKQYGITYNVIAGWTGETYKDREYTECECRDEWGWSGDINIPLTSIHYVVKIKE